MSGNVIPWWLSNRPGGPARSFLCETGTRPSNVGASTWMLASLGVYGRGDGCIDRRTPCDGGSSDTVESGRLLTDGGTPVETDGDTDRHRHLQQLFEDVTGSVAFVESQDRSTDNRCLDDHETGISTYVTDAARSDGLSDAITAPDASDGGNER